MKRQRSTSPTPSPSITLPFGLVPLEVIAAWCMGDWTIAKRRGHVWAVAEGRQILLHSNDPAETVYRDGYPAGLIPDGLAAVHVVEKYSSACGWFVSEKETAGRIAAHMAHRGEAEYALCSLLKEGD